jgi:hypothetical protein
MHARARSKQNEVRATRERLRRLDRDVVHDARSPGTKVFRLHSAEHHLDCSERRFARLARSQADLPVLVARKDGRGWWWYLDRFWWEDHGLTAQEVKIFVLDTDLRREQQAAAIARARTHVLGEPDRRDADVPISPVVRFAVWCRDRGRCVDCGTPENVGFDEILPLGNRGSKRPANVELRCDACRERRQHNQQRARVSRARAVAAAFGF